MNTIKVTTTLNLHGFLVEINLTLIDGIAISKQVMYGDNLPELPRVRILAIYPLGKQRIKLSILRDKMPVRTRVVHLTKRNTRNTHPILMRSGQRPLWYIPQLDQYKFGSGAEVDYVSYHDRYFTYSQTSLDDHKKYMEECPIEDWLQLMADHELPPVCHECCYPLDLNGLCFNWNCLT